MAEKITIQVAFDQTAQSLGSIGRVGENIARQILFDCSAVLAGRTGASIVCVVKRPKDSAPYTATLAQVGSTSIYKLVLTSTEVAVAGTVQFELRMVDGEEILKAAICTGTVESSITGISDTPDEPIADALNRLEQALAKVEAAYSRYPIIGANGNWFLWDVEAGGFVDSGVTAVGGVSPSTFTTDETLSLTDGVLSVNRVDDVEAGNTLPITSNAVHTTVGNIDSILETI